MKNAILQTLRGQKSLWFTFWVIYFLPIFVLPKIFAPFLSKMFSDMKPETLATVVGLISWLYIFYFIFSIVSLWRSASNYNGPKPWAYLAKTVLGLSVFFFCWSLLA